VFEPPYHPYSEALLSAIPEPDPLWESEQIFLSGPFRRRSIHRPAAGSTLGVRR